METKKDTKRNLPAGWRWVRLSDVCEINPRRNDITRPDMEPTWFVPMEAVNAEKGIIYEFRKRPFVDVKKGYTYFEEGDVLFAKITPCMQNGKHAIARNLIEGIGFASTEFHVIRPAKGILAEWIHHFVRQPAVLHDAINHFTGAVGQQRVPDDFLNSLEIPLPPIEEQRRIVGLLREHMAAVEKARAAAQARLGAVKNLPASLLRQVFPQPGQPLPAGWRWVKLDNVCEVRLGKMLSPASRVGFRSVPYLRNANVQWNRFDLTDIAEMDFSEEQEAALSLRTGDLLVCEGGEPGRASVWLGQISRCCYQKALHRLRPINAAVDPHFVMYRLWQGALDHEFTESNAKTTIAHLPAIRLKNLRIAIPQVEEQRRIAGMLGEQMAAVENARAAAEEELQTINALPAALLHRAFKGEI